MSPVKDTADNQVMHRWPTWVRIFGVVCFLFATGFGSAFVAFGIVDRDIWSSILFALGAFGFFLGGVYCWHTTTVTFDDKRWIITVRKSLGPFRGIGLHISNEELMNVRIAPADEMAVSLKIAGRKRPVNIVTMDDYSANYLLNRIKEFRAKYSLYAAEKPVNRRKLHQVKRIREMREKVGGFGEVSWLVSIIFVMFLFCAFGAWSIWSNVEKWSDYFGAVIVTLFAVSAGGVVVLLLLPTLRDICRGQTTLTGRIDSKWITQETSGSRPERVTITKFHFDVNGYEFTASRRIHDWLSQGDEIVVHYWRHSKAVAKVEKLSA